MNRRALLTGLVAIGAASAGRLRGPAGSAWAAGRPIRIAIVAKSLGNGVFNAVHLGG